MNTVKVGVSEGGKPSLAEGVCESPALKGDSMLIQPLWHGQILQARLESVQNGEGQFDSLENVKNRIKKRST